MNSCACDQETFSTGHEPPQVALAEGFCPITEIHSSCDTGYFPIANGSTQTRCCGFSSKFPEPWKSPISKQPPATFVIWKRRSGISIVDVGQSSATATDAQHVNAAVASTLWHQMRLLLFIATHLCAMVQDLTVPTRLQQRERGERDQPE